MTDDGHAPTVPDTHRPTPAPSATPPIPVEDRYALKTLLGRGGMGEVWVADDKRVDREIAIKVMRGGSDDPTAVARFLLEARVQGRLDHPCVVPVHDVSGDSKSPYFAMKRLTGTTLAEVIAARDQTKWPRRTLLQRFVDVCLAVEFAHQRGVIHRDLKPANIMLGDFGEAYLIDWGLARVSDSPDAPASGAPISGGGGHTEAGAMLGTPGYMSPEQMRGDSIDARTDIYALGCILFEILTGQPANARGSAAVGATLAAEEHRPSTHALDVPPELDSACALATAGDREKRVASARTLADLVQRYLDGDRDVARRRELAIKHVELARSAFEQGDAGRAEAMREAASAVALDAENRDALALLGRLLLEPPTEIPVGAQRSIRADRIAEASQMLKWIFVNYLLFFVGVIIEYTVGIAQSWPIVLIGGEIGFMTALSYLGLRRPHWISEKFAIVLVIGHAIVISTACIIMGPVLLGPSVIFGSAMVMLAGPLLRVPVFTVVLHLLIIAVPLALELAGVLPRTFSVDGASGLTFKPWAIDISQTGIVVILLGQTALQLIGNAFVLHKSRTVQDQAQQQLHVQAWQLKQLVPSTAR